MNIKVEIKKILKGDKPTNITKRYNRQPLFNLTNCLSVCYTE